MISRRTVLSTLAGGAIAIGVLPRWSPLSTTKSLATGTRKLRVASVKFGSLAWLLDTIKAEGINKKHNLEIDVVELAANNSSPVALFGGNADVIVSDWPWALRQRANGEKVKFSPFSSSLGAIMVPEQSPIKSLADLKGKRLGVAGSSSDKSWIILRAYSRKVLGADLETLAEPQYGAAPLLTEQLKSGQLDAVLNFWTFAARLEGLGYRRVISMSDVMKELGIEPQPAMVGFIWKEETEAAHGPAIDALLASAREANEVLANPGPAWDRLRGTMKAATDMEFVALRDSYRAGIPKQWGEAEMKSAEKIMAILLEGGDAELMGNGTRFDPDLFRTART